MIRTDGKLEFRGKTNIEAAKAGYAPQLNDGNLATLHHINQDGKGKLVEASRKHHAFGKEGFKQLHSVWGKNKPHPENPVNRPLFEQDAKNYWKERVKN